MTMSDLPIVIRDLHEDDISFIYNSFFKSVRESIQFEIMPTELFFQSFTQIGKQIVRENEVLVLCSTEDNSQIFGYAIFNKDDDRLILHCLYVKQVYRKFKLEELLLNYIINETESKSIVHLFELHSINHFKRSSDVPVVFNPFLLLKETT